MPIPAGSWKITAGPTIGTLTFSGTTGAVSGTMEGTPFVGFFDETSQTLTMLRNPRIGDVSPFSGVVTTPLTIFQGMLFRFTPPGTSSAVAVLTGTFYLASGNNVPTYTTWFAQNPAPVKTGKEGKDGKDGKDGHKDHKDGKDGGKDGGKETSKEHGKEAEAHKLTETSFILPGAGGPFALPQGALSPDAAEAIGKSFIEAAERPDVGAAALRADG